MSDLELRVDERSLAANWSDEAPETVGALDAALPLSGEASRWGDELYFRTAVDVGPENARERVEPGTIAYWPAGNALCLFWGPTPASEGEEPRAASPVNVVARVEDHSPLATVDGGAFVELTRG
jgi:uncharacterized protein